jgi:putative transposase
LGRTEKFIKNYKFRIYPTKKQSNVFDCWLDLCCNLYNTALQQRRDEYTAHKRNITCFVQINELPGLKNDLIHYKIPHAQVLQEVLRRVDRTFKAFFLRCERGQNPGYPRFKGYNQYDSFTFPQDGWFISAGKLILSKIPGSIKTKLHSSVVGKVKTCTIKRETCNKWYVVFAVEQGIEVPTQHAEQPVGIDLGLEYFASLSTGEQVANPRHLRKAQKRLTKVQHNLSTMRELPRTDSRKKLAKKSVSRTYKKVANQRKDFAFKLAKDLTDRFSVICLEDLKVKNLVKRPKPKEDENQPGVFLPNGASAKAGLNKSISDAGWSLFTDILAHKAVSAGVRIVKVNPAYTSQTCPSCEAIVKKELSERWHQCPCGCELHRDIAAAKVILSRGLATLGNQSLDACSEA